MICSQSYSFSHSHVQMWELDHKEGRALKNWCFQTVVLEKTLQGPLGRKKIKPVNPKGNQFSSVVQLHLTLCNPMECSMTSFPVYHQLSELTQTHVHWVSDAIQPSHPLSSPSPTFNLSQHQGLFRWVGSLHQVATVLELWHQSFQWIFRVDFLLDWLVWSPCSPRDSQEPSPTRQFKSVNSSAPSFLCSPTLTSINDYWKNHSFD